MHAASNRGERPPLPHLAADSRQLQARLYAQPDVLSPNKPLALKVVRRKPRQVRLETENGGTACLYAALLFTTGNISSSSTRATGMHPHHACTRFCALTLCSSPMQPALSAYQRFKNNAVHKTKAEEHEPSAKRKRQDSSHKTLPDIQDEQRHSILSLHEDADGPEEVGFTYPHPPLSPPKGPSARKTRSSHHIRSSVLANTDPNTVITKYSPPLETLTSTLDIIERLRKEPDLGFLYLTPSNGNKSTLYNPYQLR